MVAGCGSSTKGGDSGSRLLSSGGIEGKPLEGAALAGWSGKGVSSGPEAAICGTVGAGTMTSLITVTCSTLLLDKFL